MPGKTIAHSDAVLDLIASDHYVGLFSAAPTDAGNDGTELSGDGYVRQPITFGDKSTDVDGHTRLMSNNAPITFGPALPLAWTEATHFGIWDAESEGTLKYWGALDTPITVARNRRAEFAIGDLVVKED